MTRPPSPPTLRGEQQSFESAATLRRRLGRDLEAFPALGIKTGPILYFPSTTVEGVVTDNVRNSHPTASAISASGSRPA